MLMLYNLFFFMGFQLLSPTLPMFAVRLGGDASSAGLVAGFFTQAMSLPMAVGPVVGLALIASGDFTWLFALGGGLTAISLLVLPALRVPLHQRSRRPFGLRALYERSARRGASPTWGCSSPCTRWSRRLPGR